MGDYFAGTKVMNVVFGNDSDDVVMDKADGQLADMLGPAEIGLTHLCRADGAEWVYAHATDDWTSAGGAADDLVTPLAFRSGSIITEIHLAIEVATNGAGGDLKLYRQSRVPAGGAMPAPDLVDTIDTDIWDGLADGDATAMDYTGLTYTMAAAYNYQLFLVARNGVVCKVHEVSAVLRRSS